MEETKTIKQKIFNTESYPVAYTEKNMQSPASIEPNSVSLRSAHRKLRQLTATSPRAAVQNNHDVSTGEGYVGTLGKKWFVPSKYLPIGVDVDGLKIVSWELFFHTGYDAWKDFDGLGESAAGIHHISYDAMDRKIKEMVLNGNSVISLEGFPERYTDRINLPDGYKAVPSDGIIYDSRILTHRPELSGKVYPIPTAKDQFVISDYFDRLDGKGPIRIIHGDKIQAPSIGGAYLKKLKEPYVLIGGFHNVGQHEVRERFNVSGLEGDKLISPWPTAVARYRTRTSESLHHALISQGLDARALPPDQILKGLSELVKLMRPNAP